MSQIVCIGDNTAHSGPITTQGANISGNNGQKLFFNGIPFTTVGGIGTVHVGGHPPIPLINVIVNATQAKIFVNGIPVARYGAVCSCGDIVVGSNVNPKIFIE